jgi:DNA-binding PadR family transcriptional regulator
MVVRTTPGKGDRNREKSRQLSNTPRGAELMPEILVALRQGPMTRTPLMKRMEQYSTDLGYKALRPEGFTHALTMLVDDQRIERTGRGSYAILQKGFEEFTAELGLRLSEEHSARSKHRRVP